METELSSQFASYMEKKLQNAIIIVNLNKKSTTFPYNRCRYSCSKIISFNGVCYLCTNSTQLCEHRKKSSSSSDTETELPSVIFLLYRHQIWTGYKEGTGFTEALNNFSRSDKK